MTDPIKPPIITPIDAAEEAARDDEEGLPEHELREETTAGAGVMSQGGTAVDRGTGTLEGRAQGPKADDDEGDPLEAPVDPDKVMPSPNLLR